MKQLMILYYNPFL